MLKISIKLFIVVLTVAFFGCSKNADKQTIEKDPVIMTFDKVEPVSGMRVFTGGGVVLDSIADSREIQSYLARNYSLKTSTGVRFYQSKFFEAGINDEYRKTAFTFYGDGRVSYTGAEIINVKDLGDTRIFKSTVTNKIEDDPIVRSELFKYKLDTKLNGTYNYQYVVRGDTRATQASLLYYKFVQYDNKGHLKSLSFGTVHNELNDLFVKTLTRFDTLAVKAYTIKYSVK